MEGGRAFTLLKRRRIVGDVLVEILPDANDWSLRITELLVMNSCGDLQVSKQFQSEIPVRGSQSLVQFPLLLRRHLGEYHGHP